MRFENLFIQLEIQCLDAKTRTPLPEVTLGEQTIFTAKPGDLAGPKVDLWLAKKNTFVLKAMPAGQEFHVCTMASGSCFDMQPPGYIDALCYVGESHNSGVQ